MHTRSVVLVVSILLCAGVLALAARHADVPGLRVAIAATPANGLKGHYYNYTTRLGKSCVRADRRLVRAHHDLGWTDCGFLKRKRFSTTNHK